MKSLRLLLIEDSLQDEKLILHYFKKSDYVVTHQRVQEADELRKALAAETWDIVISDYIMPRFSGLDAVQIVKQNGQDVPVIIVSGTIGEETAVRAMRAGADDYLMKENLPRLAPAVDRAIREAQDRRRRRHAENSLREKERNLEALFNSGIESVFLADASHRIVWVNNIATETSFLHVNKRPAVGDNLLEFIMPRHRQVFENGFQLCLKGQAHVYEQDSVFPGNVRLWHQVKFYPVYDEGSRIIGVSVSILDITKRKRAETGLEEMRLRMEGIINSAFDAIITTNAEHRIVMFNQAAEQMFGYQTPVVVGEPISRLLPETHHVDYQRRIHSFLQSDNPSPVTGIHMPMTGKRANGEEFPLEASVSQVGIGDKTYLTVIMRDTTLRIRAEIQEKQLVQQLLKQNERLQQFAYFVSHNLRGPVSTLAGLADLYDHENTTNAENVRITKHVSDVVVKLDGIIHDMVHILEDNASFLQRYEQIPLADLLDSALTTLGPALSAANAEIESRFEQMPILASVRSHLHSIFYNLISNALKYRAIERQLRLVITASRTGHTTTLTFTDNGIGIDLMRYRHQLFGLYKRFHAHVEGKGIGLYLVKTQVEALGGTIDVQSVVGRGTEFIICLPDPNA